MRLVALSFAVFVVSLPLSARAQESVDQMVRDFAPLVSTVRGAVRHQIEQSKGCLPWASLAVDPNDQKEFVNFGFTAEMAKGLGDDPAKAIASRLSPVASKGPFTVSAIGTCETDASIGGKSPNVITLLLERRGGMALKLRFPFEQGSNGQIAYVANKATIEKVERLVFKQPNP